jgi:hypothetical protein
MEETPTDASQEGVQVRTEDGRVATVVSKGAAGWYLTRLDGVEGNVQKNFFASDGQDLPRLLASVPKAKTDDSATSSGVISNWEGAKSALNQPWDTILPFVRRPPADGDQLLVRWANDDGSTREDGYYVCVLRGGQLYGDWEEPVPFNADDDDWLFMNGEGAVTETITIGAIAAERGHPENTWGYAGSTVVKSLVPQPVAEWQPPSKGKSAYAVRKVLVKQEDGEWTQVTLKKKSLRKKSQQEARAAAPPHGLRRARSLERDRNRRARRRPLEEGSRDRRNWRQPPTVARGRPGGRRGADRVCFRKLCHCGVDEGLS